MICLQTPSFVWYFQDGRQLASKHARHKQSISRSSPIFEISGFGARVLKSQREFREYLTLFSCSSSFYRALPASIVLSQLFSCSPSFYRVSRTRRSVKIMNHFFNCSCLTYVCCKMKSRFVLQHQSPSRVTREFKM